MRADWRQEPLPHMKPVERGRPFAPPYETELAEFDVDTSELEHVCSARFGAGRPCRLTPRDTTTWTGDSHRYDIFRFKGERPWMALRWSNGGGDGWLLPDRLRSDSESCLIELIAGVVDEPTRWDYCHFLYLTAHRTALAAARGEAAKYSRAFVEKRLRQRKVRGESAYRVEIVPAEAVGR